MIEKPLSDIGAVKFLEQEDIRLEWPVFTANICVAVTLVLAALAICGRSRDNENGYDSIMNINFDIVRDAR